MQNNKNWRKLKSFFTAVMKAGNQILRDKKFLMKKQHERYQMVYMHKGKMQSNIKWKKLKCVAIMCLNDELSFPSPP